MEKESMTTIRVLKEDIRHGKLRDSCLCPVALAVERELKRASISVDYGYITADYGNKTVVIYKTPEIVHRFMVSYDHHRFVAPFSFELGDPLPLRPDLERASRSEFL